MPHETIEVSGKIEYVFAHRFVVQTAKGAVLADLTPHGADLIELRVGAEVRLEGEMKPSELKVSRFASGGKCVSIPHKKPDHGHHAPADPDKAIAAARAAGFELTGKPRRKPKHFEIDGRRNGQDFEVHVELDGRIRKAKPLGEGHSLA